MLLLRLSLEIAGLLGLTWWLLSEYKDHRVNGSVQFAAYVSWVLGLMNLLLLPADIILLGVQHEKEEFYATFVGLWQSAYWLTFLMSWLVLPFLIEFSCNGDFTLDKKVRNSLCALFFHWTLLVCIGLAAVIYLIFVGHFSVAGISALAMASANTYGLLWVISLLGYGMVSIPKTLWELRHPENRLKKLYFDAVHAHEDRMETIFVYEDAVKQVNTCYQRMLKWESASIVLTGEMQYVRNCLLQVIELIENESFTSYKKRSLSIGSTDSVLPPTEKEVVELHRRVRTAQNDLRAAELAWLELCIEAEKLLERDLKRDIPPSCLFPETSPANRLRNAFLTGRWALRRMLTPQIATFGAALSGIFSLIILWSELTMGWDDRFSLFSYLLSDSAGLLAEIVVFSVLLYLVLCCYQAIFTMRILERFALRAHNNTSELSLLKVSLYQCRIQFSLGYNFLLLVNRPKIMELTAFHELFRQMRLVHFFGTDFSVYAPVVMIVLAGVTWANGYARLMKRIGVEQSQQLMFGCADHEVTIHRGEALIRKGVENHQAAISKKLKEHDSSASYGFALSSDAARSLLSNDMHEPEIEEKHILV